MDVFGAIVRRGLLYAAGAENQKKTTTDLLGFYQNCGEQDATRQSPTDFGTGKAKDEKAPLSEITEVLNERFGTQFMEEAQFFFQQIKEKACKNKQVIQTALANPLDKFERASGN